MLQLRAEAPEQDSPSKQSKRCRQRRKARLNQEPQGLETACYLPEFGPIS
jgi:hypothetical protein